MDMKKIAFILVGIILGITGAAGQPSAAQAASQPLCSKVWVKGHVLPKHYHGCRGGVVLTYDCHVLATERHHVWLWAKRGHKIRTGQQRMMNYIYNNC